MGLILAPEILNAGSRQAELATILRRPDIAPSAIDVSVRVDVSLDQAFVVDMAGSVRIAPSALADPLMAPVFVRHALELALLGRILPREPDLAGLAAARVCALFFAVEGGPARLPDAARLIGPVLALAADKPDGDLAAIWRSVAVHQPHASSTLGERTAAKLATLWPVLGPTEYLLTTGGDVRQKLDPLTGLNRYGCSPRPRPWAITYASSTASSISERGYAAAEQCRRWLLADLASTGAADAARVLAQEIKSELRAFYGLGSAIEVVLAASGTDTEFATLAVALAGNPDPPLDSILVAPEETGTGVPLAALGRHFAESSALGEPVSKGDLLEGFNADVTTIGIALRDPDGAVRDPADVEDEIERVVQASVARGRRVLLHALDLSKTGLLGPRPAFISSLLSAHSDRVDVVVDACQARVEPETLRHYLDIGCMVQVTGSKFFTGPPFAGALLLPSRIGRRLARSAGLPAGLVRYAWRHEWPGDAKTDVLSGQVNYGLLLRWVAALAEMRAFAAVPASERFAILRRFGETLRRLAEASPNIELLEVPALDRADADGWDRLRTIFAIRVVERGADGGARPLSLEGLTEIYRLLNRDCSPALPADAHGTDARLAATRCHIGQPVVIGTKDGEPIAALRISAGARLVSGEPSHAGLRPDQRLAHELADVETVLEKISWAMRHRAALRDAAVPVVFEAVHPVF